MFKLEYNFFIKDGKFHLRNKAQFMRECQSLPDCEGSATFEKKKSKRSQEQNAYWWVCMTLLGNHLGYRKDEMHSICKFLFLKAERVDEKTGEVFEYLKSTTELTKSEFAEMVERMIQWSAEHGVVIPEPNQQLRLVD